VRVDNADGDPQLTLGEGDRLFEIGVIGEHDRNLAVAPERVEQEVGGQVHVGTLLLGLDHLHRHGASRHGMGQRHPGRMRQEVTEVDGHVRVGGKRPQVHLLALLLLIAGPVGHPGGGLQGLLPLTLPDDDSERSHSAATARPTPPVTCRAVMVEPPSSQSDRSDADRARILLSPFQLGDLTVDPLCCRWRSTAVATS
jgi:hypothetical protein